MRTPWGSCVGRVGVAAVVILTLAACETFKAKVQYVPYEVKVPVAVPCAAEIPAEPEWATKALRKSDSLDTKAKELLAEREQRMGYEEKVKAAVAGCR